jgi:hypothetical protein
MKACVTIKLVLIHAPFLQATGAFKKPFFSFVQIMHN